MMEIGMEEIHWLIEVVVLQQVVDDDLVVHEMSHEIIQEGDEHHQVDEIKPGQVDLNQIQPLHCEHVSGHVWMMTMRE